MFPTNRSVTMLQRFLLALLLMLTLAGEGPVAPAQAQSNVTGPAIPPSPPTGIGNLPLWANTGGTSISDSGIHLNMATPPAAYPCSPAIDGGCLFPIVQSPLVVGTQQLCPLDQNCVFTGNNVYPFS